MRLTQAGQRLGADVFVTRPMLDELRSASVLDREIVRLYGEITCRYAPTGEWEVARFHARGFDLLDEIAD